MADLTEDLKRSLETGDAELWKSLHAEDFEMDELWHKTDPLGKPNKRRRDDTVATIEWATANWVKFEVDNMLTDGNRLAYTVKCLMPSGRVVVANATAEIEDGLIVREMQVSAGKPD